MIVLTFRDLQQRDIGELVKSLNNENVVRFLTTRIPQPYTASDAETWINEDNKVGMTKVILLDEIFVGVIGVTPGEFENSRSAEIGYWLEEAFWGKGIATEAVKMATELVFTTTEIVRLFAPIFATNIASISVIKKCGYKLEGICEKAIYKNRQYIDEHIYANIYS